MWEVGRGGVGGEVCEEEFDEGVWEEGVGEDGDEGWAEGWGEVEGVGVGGGGGGGVFQEEDWDWRFGRVDWGRHVCCT